MLSENDTPSKRSQAADIEDWLIEFFTGKGEVRKTEAVSAAKQFNGNWSDDNITKVFNRRMKKEGSHSRTGRQRKKQGHILEPCRQE